jgi:thioredoxin-related protein
MFTVATSAQEQKVNIFNPTADAKAELTKAIDLAKKENKHIMVDIGGNWCSWCVRLHKLFTTDLEIDSLLKADYVFVRVNYSKENMNIPVLTELEFPQRFGFPVLVVLNNEGKRIHTQNSGLLEMDKGYDRKKVVEFLKQWNKTALDPNSYKK